MATLAGTNIDPRLKFNYDYFSPYMRATIITDPSDPTKRYPLWMNLGKDSDYNTLSPFQLDGYAGSGAKAKTNISSLAFLSSLTVELQLDAIPRISASLTPPYLDAREFIDSALMDWGSSNLEVQIGYVGSKDGTYLSPPFIGRLDKPDVTFGTDVTIGLTAQGIGGYFAATTGAASVGSPTYVMIEEQIKNLTTAAGIDIDRAAWRLGAKSNALIRRMVVASYSTLNVLDAIYNLAKDCGCTLYFSNKGLVLLSYETLVTGEPEAILRLYDYDSAIGPQNGVYPILSVSSDSRGIFLSKDIKQTFSQKMTAEKQTSTSESKPGEKGTATGAAQKQATYKNQPTSKAVDAKANASDVDQNATKSPLQVTAEEIINEESRTGYKLEIETIGMPQVIPGMMLSVQGVSTRIDNNYVVYAVKHSLSASGFQTSLTVQGNYAALTTSINTTYNTNLANPQTAAATSSNTNSGATTVVEPAPQAGAK